jgi:porphobilinogen synthase
VSSVFPVTRLRRFRRTAALRELVREARVDVRDLVYPLFACPGEGVERPLEGLEGIAQRSIDRLCDEAERVHGLGVGAAILFGIPEEKDEAASGAYDEDGIVQQALRALRERAPDLVLLTDVCLCEYTSHGHCGVVDAGEVVNDLTLELLAKTALSHAEAGADAVCPSDMMDGRVGAIRATLDAEGFEHVRIVASGGFDVERIQEFERNGVPVDSYGVGSALIRGENDFTADVVAVDGKPCAKVGRTYRLNTRLEPVA